LGKWLLANNMGSIMDSRILAGASTLAFVVVVASAGLASAQNWRCFGGCYPDSAYPAGYAYAPGPLYSYDRAYDSIPWNYRGGPHPR
jgi:hypothetical protein